MKKLLNWDHEVIPTSLEDLFENFCVLSRKYTGYVTRVRIDGDHFVAQQLEGGEWRLALILDLRAPSEVFLGAREVYGRLHYLIERVSAVSLARHIDECDSLCRVA